MAVNVYEGMFILDANRYARDTAGVSGQIPELIEKAGGQMLASRLWEERRLAYSINGHRKGTYWLTYFKLDADALAGLTRQFQLRDNILRTLFLKVDPRIADALVSHATAEPTTAKTEVKPTVAKTEVKPTVAKTEVKPAADKTEVKPAADKTEAKPAADKTEAEPTAASTDDSDDGNASAIGGDDK